VLIVGQRRELAERGVESQVERGLLAGDLPMLVRFQLGVPDGVAELQRRSGGRACGVSEEHGSAQRRRDPTRGHQGQRIVVAHDGARQAGGHEVVRLPEQSYATDLPIISAGPMARAESWI